MVIRLELAERIAVYRTEFSATGFGPEEIKRILDPIISFDLKNQEDRNVASPLFPNDFW